MKLTAQEEKRKEEIRELRHRRRMIIYDAWVKERNNINAVDRLAEQFNVSRNTILTALSYVIKFTKDAK